MQRYILMGNSSTHSKLNFYKSSIIILNKVNQRL